jgi:diadenosine tetraphosphate (Ap4A) HIT family hydrolase
VDITNLTETDLARLALSARLRDLSEAFRVAVAAEDGATTGAAPNGATGAAPDGQPALANRLWSLLSTELPKLEEAIVQHLRSSGASWAEVGALGSLTEDQARERWKDVELSPSADPVAEAAALDEWYIRHAQLEPLAQVRDPFSRLLSAHAAQEHECLICVKYRGGALPAYGGYTSPPGGYLVDDGMWRVGHGPTPYWPAGTLLIESYRHYLDFAEMQEEEAATIGPLIHRFVGPLKRATGASRIHVFSCMEGAEHFHLWLVPRVGEVSSGRSFIANPGFCGVSEAEQVISRLRHELAGAGTG